MFCFGYIVYSPVINLPSHFKEVLFQSLNVRLQLLLRIVCPISIKVYNLARCIFRIFGFDLHLQSWLLPSFQRFFKHVFMNCSFHLLGWSHVLLIFSLRLISAMLFLDGFHWHFNYLVSHRNRWLLDWPIMNYINSFFFTKLNFSRRCLRTTIT